MNLFEELIRRPPESELWYWEGRWITVGEVVSRIRAVGGWERFRGKRVALAPTSAIDLAWILVCLDGLVDSLLLLPSEQSVEVHAEMAALAHAQVYRIADGEEPGVLPPFAFGAAGSNRPRDAGADYSDERGTSQWLIPTSGTTGKPKIVAHSLSTLSRTAKREKERGRLIYWGLLYELARFAGLQVFLQAIFGGSALVLTDQRHGLDARVSALRNGRCNALSATPSLWRKIMMLGPDIPTPKLRWITLGGEIADQPILNALAHRFPDARITHVYASTEAGVGFSVSDGQEGFPASYLRSATKGVSLQIDEDGQLLLKAEGATQKYIDRRSASTNCDGWIETGDLVRSSADGSRFLFIGRAAGVINVGGSKVHPAEIERVILEVPGVAMVSVGARKNSILGHVVEAKVVPAEEEGDPAGLRRRILEHCRFRLERFQQPGSIQLVSSIELSAAGKLGVHHGS